MVDVAAQPRAVDVVKLGAFLDPAIGRKNVVDVAARDAAGLGVGTLPVEVEDGIDRRPGEVVPAQFAHPGLILSTADRREWDAADGIRPEDMPPDEDRPAAASAGNQVRAVSVGSNDGGPAGDRLDYRLCLEPGESEAETIDARGLDCGEGGFEGLRMEEIVLVGKGH